jgi:hypothetical protein
VPKTGRNTSERWNIGRKGGIKEETTSGEVAQQEINRG